MREFMKNFKRDNSRCVYENNDILITNDTMTDVSDDKVVVMMVHLKKEGQIWRTEIADTQQK